MGVLGWIILGLIVGALANLLVPGRFPGGIFGTIVGGALGAFLGGVLFSAITGRGITGFDVVSLAIAFAGAALLLTLLRLAGGAKPHSAIEQRTRA